MSKIILGTWTDGGAVKLDLPRLLVTRMLIQANSGGGKSWALRGLLERTAGQVQQLIVDPEGEFASLREKHDLVIIAATGGDAAAHPRTAALLAHRLLETEASAVLDISELKAHDRHAFVRIFFESLIDAPKDLRHPVLVALDEAQLFAPEKGQGESEASAAVIDIATRGRKRGLCLVAATQRISMFHKGVAAELKNRMIGGTSLDVDVKRAAFDLGMPPKDALTILRALEPGHFFVFGPALAQVEPREFVTGDIETSHPKVGHRQNIAPPKPTAAILALLPKLADLPREAEERARSLDDLKKELAQARRELSLAKKQTPPAPIVKGDPEAMVKLREQAKGAAASVKQLKAILGELMKFIVRINAEGFKSAEATEAIKTAIDAGMAMALKQIEASAAKRNALIERLQAEGQRLLERAQALAQTETVEIEVTAARNAPFTVQTPKFTPVKSAEKPTFVGDAGARDALPPVQQRILDALAEAEQISAEAPDRSLVAILSGYTHIQSTGFVKALGALSSAGMITYPPGGRVALTDTGRAIVIAPEAPTTAEELQERVSKLIGGAASKVLRPLIEANRVPITRQQLAEASGYGHVQSTGFVKTLGRLRTLGFIDYPSSGMVVAQPVLFLE